MLTRKDDPPVSENGNTIRDLKDLPKAMGYVNDVKALTTEIAQVIEKKLRLRLRQRDCGFIQNEQLYARSVEGFGHFDELAHGKRERPNRRVRIDFDRAEQGAEEAGHAFTLLSPTDQAPARQLIAKKDILGDRQRRN